MAAELKLYIKTWCSWCIAARDYLDNHGYRYTPIDVLSDESAYQEMIRLSGQRFTPTLAVGDNILADFGPEDLERFLRENDIQP